MNGNLSLKVFLVHGILALAFILNDPFPNYDHRKRFKLMNFTTYYNPINESGPSNWGSSYSFTGLFKCPPATSIQSHIEHIFSKTKTSVLKDDLQAMYSVKSRKVKDEDYDMEKLLMINYQRKPCISNKK